MTVTDAPGSDDQEIQLPQAPTGGSEIDALVDAWMTQLPSDRDELEEMMRRIDAVGVDQTLIEEEEEIPPPVSREEVYKFFQDRFGINVPTVAVCEGHTAHFDVIYAIVTFSIRRLLWIVSRGGSKTSSMAWCHAYNAETWPGYSGFTLGASSNQSEACYEHLLPYVVEGGVIGGRELPHIVQSTQRKTVYRNGSRVEIPTGATIAAVNGPRHPRLHRDEVEILYNEKPDVYTQAINIPAGRDTKDGRYMPAQIVDTSTMKWAHGIVSRELKAYLEAKEKEVEPEKHVFISCIYESAREVSACQHADPAARRARLIERGMDPDSICKCDKIIKGDWGDEARTPRKLSDSCGGKLFRSRGFKGFDDIETLYYANPRRTWESEQECRKPSGEGVYIESFDKNIQGIRAWTPDPDYGEICGSVDWGGTAQHAVHWWQIVNRDLETVGWSGKKVIVPKGAFVCFAEHFEAGIGNIALGRKVQKKNDVWRARWPGWRVKEWYPDNHNPGAIADWRDELGFVLVSRIKKDFDEEVKYVRDLNDDRMVFYVISKVPHMVESMEGWREENGREVEDELTHCFAAGSMVETEIGPQPIEEVAVGTRVQTRGGLRDVVWSGPTKVDRIVEVWVEGSDHPLRCTAEHRIWTQRGWVEALNLLPSDTLLAWNDWKSTLKLSPTCASGSSSTGSPTRESAASTSRAARAGGSGFTGIFGSSITGQFRKAMRSITSMRTKTTTSSRTSNAFLDLSIVASIFKSELAHPRTSLSLLGFDLSPRLLWLGPKFEQQLVRERKSGSLGVRLMGASASGAARSFDLARSLARSSAATIVDLLLGVLSEKILKRGSASGAASPSRRTNISATDFVLGRVERVEVTPSVEQLYDLTVDEDHEFFVDGFLVHNCAAGHRYFAHNRRVLHRAAVAQDRSDPPAAGEPSSLSSEDVVRTYRRSPRSGGRTVVGVVGAQGSPNRPRGTNMADDWRRQTRPFGGN